MARAKARRQVATGLPLVLVTLLVGTGRGRPLGSRGFSSSNGGGGRVVWGGTMRPTVSPPLSSSPCHTGRAWRPSPPTPMAIIPLGKLGQAYSDWLLRKPFVANLISGTSMVVLGDVISQVIEDKANKAVEKLRALLHLDSRRLFNTAIAGVVFNGLLLPQWYVLIHKWMPVETPKTIAIKICCNCVAWGLAGNGLGMLMRRMLEGERFEHAMQEVKRDLPGVVANDYKIWPLYDVLCFTVIPRHIQAVSTGMLGVAWCTYISWVIYGKENKKEEENKAGKSVPPR